MVVETITVKAKQHRKGVTPWSGCQCRPKKRKMGCTTASISGDSRMGYRNQSRKVGCIIIFKPKIVMGW
jgi:hypothetical protein